MASIGSNYSYTPDSEANLDKVPKLVLVDAQPTKRKTTSSKERRKRYVKALERAVESLRTNSTSLTAQLNHLHDGKNDLTSKRTELKLQMQSLENKVHLQSERNDALKKEIEELRSMIHQSIQNFQEMNDFEMGAPMPSPSHTDSSSVASPSKDAIAISFRDYRLF